MQKRVRTKVIALMGILLLIVIGVLVAVLPIEKVHQEIGAVSEVEQVIEEDIPPTLIVETQKVSLSEETPFSIKVLITSLGEAYYPAASMSISFDASRLEFLGVKEGNVFIRNEAADSNIKQQLPKWSYNVAQCNKSGVINIMYLDTTGGKNSFCQELLSEENNILLKLEFCLRGSARKDDIYDLIVEDAVFAASDEALSLSVVQDTLQIRDGKIVVGE